MRVYLASAGTGKTHALVEELKGLIQSGVPLRRIAALTFTRKAAEELRGRAKRAVLALSAEDPRLKEAEREVHGALFTTIHGFMAEALRHTAPLMGLDPDFALLDTFLAEALFLEEARSLLYRKGLDGGLAGALLHLYRKRTLAETLHPLPGAEGVFALYLEALEGYRRRLPAFLSPSDLEALALRILGNPEALRRVVERFPHILLDEYQDTGPLQGRFFQGLKEAGARLVAVGDPKQSIYLFRNARVEVFREALKRAEEVRYLSTTYRHAQAVAEFLNRFTALFGEEGVRVRPHRQEVGRVEVHWVVGEGGLEEKRRAEAHLLLDRLMALREEGYAFSQMAVLVRSRSSLPPLEAAFRARGVPYALGRGRSFFARPEVRDLYHALRLSLLEGPPGPEERLALLAFLRGPWVGLDLSGVEEALKAQDPIPLLPEAVQAKLTALRALADLPPLEALKRLSRDEAFWRRLSPRARVNLDALLLLAAMERFPDLEALLEWLRLRAEDPEAAELPEGEEGVQVLTVHGAKGLEWPVVALFDLSRGENPKEEDLLVGLGGEVALRGTPAYKEVRKALRKAQAEEARRLLYVALSRARDVLIVTGSASGRPGPWVRALERLGLGPGSQDPLVRRHPFKALPPLGDRPQTPPPPPLPAPYAHLAFPERPLPFVYSPSAFTKAKEPVPLAEALEKEALPEFYRALGTLVHYAIARHLDPEDEGAMAGLLLQEVAFPFAEGEKRRLLEEVRDLLRRYRGMLGPSLPPLEAREEDHAELPLVLPLGGTVWYGILDRLYRVGGRWYLEDYKTDREVRPEAYRFQLAVYRRALLEAWGVEAEARLVYLRHGLVHPLAPEELERALKESLRGMGPGEGGEKA
jgi:ATP-dependent helicase/nuclease subunit A